ncbi:high-affinity choline transporter 1-like isoform X2 [Takifugu rubripes]|uniref:high-affinity choline transporter 1-like isoform X2 n=1 Tax=Takifugu rubripes TaxID=31033 RepID=UPI0011458786|nr:high-affinity choline transporter 1-like isoform X2 [Takifugu rubripes]
MVFILEDTGDPLVPLTRTAVNMALNVPGLIMVIVFYIVILGIGLFAAWKSKKAEKKGNGDRREALLLGNRNIDWLVGIFTMTATWVGGGFIMGVAEIVYNPKLGLIWALMPVQYSLSFVIGGLFMAKPMRERKYITMMDPFQSSKIVSIRLHLHVQPTGATLSVILDLPFGYSVWISAVVAIIYTLMGGLYSVAYTDVIQLALVFFSLWLCVPYLMTSKISVSITETAFKKGFQEPWLGTLNKGNIWNWIDEFLMIGLGSLAFQCFHQRILSSSSPRKAQICCFGAAALVSILGIPSVLIGAVAASTDWNQTLYGSPSPYERGEQSFIMPLALQNLAPSYISVVGIGAITAAVMSSADSGMLSATSIFSSNIYKNIVRKQASNKEMQWVIRITVVVVGVAGTALTSTSNSLLTLWILALDLSYTLIFPHLISVLFFQMTNGYGGFAGAIIGLTFRILLGENSIGLPVLLRLPGCTLVDGVYTQSSPVRTVSMLFSFTTILVISRLAEFMFNHRLLPRRWDVFKVTTIPAEEEHVSVRMDLMLSYNQSTNKM